MAKASLTLPSGTIVQIEGSADDIRDLLAFYGGTEGGHSPPPRKKGDMRAAGKKVAPQAPNESDILDITQIVNLVKSCNEAEGIEAHILDKSSQVDRVLLPLYIVHEYLDDAHALSSGDVTAVTTQLSVPVAQPNASRTLSGTASKYVIGDSTRKKGSAVRYKLNRRGAKYLRSVITGDSGDS